MKRLIKLNESDDFGKEFKNIANDMKDVIDNIDTNYSNNEELLEKIDEAVLSIDNYFDSLHDDEYESVSNQFNLGLMMECYDKLTKLYVKLDKYVDKENEKFFDRLEIYNKVCARLTQHTNNTEFMYYFDDYNNRLNNKEKALNLAIKDAEKEIESYMNQLDSIDDKDVYDFYDKAYDELESIKE